MGCDGLTKKLPRKRFFRIPGTLERGEITFVDSSECWPVPNLTQWCVRRSITYIFMKLLALFDTEQI